MKKFFGDVGYAASSVESAPGVFTNGVVEKQYYGDIVQNFLRLQENDNLNKDLVLSNMISVVADDYAYEHVSDIRYVRWAGAVWTVNSVDVRRPRLILRLGGVYNGPTAS
jgi:hypothetical protein